MEFVKTKPRCVIYCRMSKSEETLENEREQQIKFEQFKNKLNSMQETKTINKLNSCNALKEEICRAIREYKAKE